MDTIAAGEHRPQAQEESRINCERVLRVPGEEADLQEKPEGSSMHLHQFLSVLLLNK